MGAKNHGVIMPDANKESTLNQLVGAAFGAAGQRCMALSTAVFVGEAQKWIPDLVQKALSLKVNAGHEPNTDVGPLISPAAKKRVCELIESSKADGAKIILDGRDVVVKGYENGNFVGPTIISGVKVSEVSFWVSLEDAFVAEHEVLYGRDLRSSALRDGDGHSRRGGVDHQQQPVR